MLAEEDDEGRSATLREEASPLYVLYDRVSKIESATLRSPLPSSSPWVAFLAAWSRVASNLSVTGSARSRDGCGRATSSRVRSQLSGKLPEHRLMRAAVRDNEAMLVRESRPSVVDPRASEVRNTPASGRD